MTFLDDTFSRLAPLAHFNKLINSESEEKAINSNTRESSTV